MVFLSCRAAWVGFVVGGGLLVWCAAPRVRCPRPLRSCSPVCTLCVWCCVCGVLGHLAHVHRCACLGVLRRVHGVLGLLAPVHRCARSARGVMCAASWATWLLFTGVHALRVVLRVRCLGPLGSCSPVCLPWCAVSCARCPGPLGSGSPVCTLCVRCCGCGALGLLVPVLRCACSLCCVVCAVFWATWLLFSGVHALCAVSCVWSPGPFGSCFLVCSCGVCCVACVVSWDTWFVLSGVFGLCVAVCCGVCGVRCAVLRVWCSGPPGPGSPVHTLGVWCCVRLVSWASWLLFTGVFVWCVVWCVRRPGPPGSCSPVCVCGVLCGVHGVLGLVAPVHRCARSVCGVLCVVSWASWLLCTGVLLWCVVRCVRCPGPLGSCSPVCALGVRCFVFSVLGLLAPVHRCVCVVCCVVYVASWATWLLFTGVLVWCVVWCARCPGPRGSCSPVCTLGVRCFVRGVLGLLAPVRSGCFCGVLCGVCGGVGHLAPVHRCARSVRGVLCLVTWASWLLFTRVPVSCVVWCVRCPGPLGSRSPVCPRGVCCVACAVSWASWLLFTGVLCACSVCCVLCAVSWATWLLFTGVHARCGVWCVVCVVWVWVCAHVCHTVLVAFFVVPKSRRCRCTPLGLMCASMTYGPCVVDSLYFATPKSRRVCLMYS